MTSLHSSLLRVSAALVLAMPVTAAGQGAVRETPPDTARGVPRGMLPPAGKCRVWMEGVPATRQPAPTDCATAMRKKPANARILYGPNTPEQRQAGLDAARERRSLLTPIGERRPALAQDGARATPPAPRTRPATSAPAALQPAARQPAARQATAVSPPSPPTPTKTPPPPPKKPERP